MARAASEARKTITCARSAGATQRRGSAFGIAARFSGVSMIVGSTQFTLMFFSRSSAAIVSVRRITALFEAMAKALLEWETIDADQIADIMAGKPPRAPKPAGSQATKPPAGGETGTEGATAPAASA